MLVRRRALFAKLETTPGTDAAPGVTDAVLMRSVNPSPLNQETVERTLVRPFMGSFQNLPTRANVTIEAEMEVAGFGVPGPATPIAGYDALLRICALSRTLTADTKVDYAPVSEGIESATVYFYQDGMLHKLFGCKANLTLRMGTNEVPVYRFTIMGLYGGVSDVALPTPNVAAYQTPLAVNPINTTAFSLHSIANLPFQSLEINLGNNLVHRNLPNAAESIRITNRNVTGTLEVEAPKVAGFDVWAAVRAATLGPLSLTHGPAGNQIVVSGPTVQLTNPRYTENEETVHLQLGLALVPAGAGNNELLLSVR